MKSLFALAPEPLPDIVTDNICEMAKIFPEEEGKIGPNDINTEGIKDNTIRDCKIRWIHPDSDETKKLTNLCTSLFHDANKMFFGVDLTKIFHIQSVVCAQARTTPRRPMPTSRAQWLARCRSAPWRLCATSMETACPKSLETWPLPSRTSTPSRTRSSLSPPGGGTLGTWRASRRYVRSR